MIRIARVVAPPSECERPESSSASSISGSSDSVSNTESTPWRIAAIRSRPIPVSMFF
jgi:hypothetical protein